MNRSQRFSIHFSSNHKKENKTMNVRDNYIVTLTVRKLFNYKYKVIYFENFEI